MNQRAAKPFPPGNTLNKELLLYNYELMRALINANLCEERVPTLSRSESIIARLVRNAKSTINVSILHDVLYKDRIDGGPLTKTVIQFVTLINKKNLPWRIRAKGRNGGFIGYYMNKEDQAAFDAWLKQEELK